MEIAAKSPPRKYTIKGVTISHVANVTLEADEMITFCTNEGAQYDVTAKEWGFYATPSLNSRLPANGFRPTLVKNPEGQRYVLLVEQGRESAFDEYCVQQSIKILAFLDDDHINISD